MTLRFPQNARTELVETLPLAFHLWTNYRKIYNTIFPYYFNEPKGATFTLRARRIVSTTVVSSAM